MTKESVKKKIRVWKLGSLEHKIVPGPDMISKFAEVLNKVYEIEGDADIIWGPALEVFEVENFDEHDNVIIYTKEDGTVDYLKRNTPISI